MLSLRIIEEPNCQDDSAYVPRYHIITTFKEGFYKESHQCSFNGIVDKYMFAEMLREWADDLEFDKPTIVPTATKLS